MKQTFECHKANCKHVNSKRTLDQNAALHLYFSLVADELNAAGFPIKATLEHYKVDIDWSAESVKSLIWKPIQKHLTGKKSTTELKKTGEIDEVYDHINRWLSNEPFNVHVPFPNDPEKQKEKGYTTKKYDIEYPEDNGKGTAFD